MSSFQVEADELDSKISATKSFYADLIAGNFDAVENFLSPDCRLQDQFEMGRGLSGIDQCMNKLKETQPKLVSTKGMDKMLSPTLMRNKKQVRFVLHGKIGFLSITIGWAVEWSCGIITSLVIIKNTTESVFFIDNTPLPSPRNLMSAIDQEELNDICGSSLPADHGSMSVDVSTVDGNEKIVPNESSQAEGLAQQVSNHNLHYIIFRMNFYL